jgi:hypothetical protein
MSETGEGDEDLSHVCEFVLGSSPWKGNKTSAIWKYFSHLDLDIHHDLKTWRACMVCRRNGIDKALNCTESSSTGCMIEHLKRHHPEEFEQFQKERDEKIKNKQSNKTNGEITMTTKTGKLRGPYKKRNSSAMESISVDAKVPIIRLAGDAGSAKSGTQKLQEELDRLMKLQKMAEDRLDNIAVKLEAGRTAMSPFDVALLQDRKESAVKNVQSIGRKVDNLCDRLND